MSTPYLFRLALLFMLAIPLCNVQAQSQPVPVPASQGFWVVETPAKGRQCTVRFYTSQRELIYEETLPRALNIGRRQTVRTLNSALEQALFVWNTTHRVPTERQWVAVHFERKP